MRHFTHNTVITEVIRHILKLKLYMSDQNAHSLFGENQTRQFTHLPPTTNRRGLTVWVVGQWLKTN